MLCACGNHAWKPINLGLVILVSPEDAGQLVFGWYASRDSRGYITVRRSLNHKGRVARLADLLGFGHRRVKALYHNELGTSLRADEMQAVAALRKGIADDRGEREAGYRLLEARIAALEELIAGIDPGLVGRTLDQVRASAHGQGGSVPRRRAGD